MAMPSHKKIDQRSVMVPNSENRIAELGKLLKGKIQTDWTLLDQAYREAFDELLDLLRHRDSVVACVIRASERGANRERTDDRVDAVGMQAIH
jgi:hypothetical protein